VKAFCSRRAPLALLFAAFLLALAGIRSPAAVANENWPQWRGPTGNGVSDSKRLPTTWNLEKNEHIVWKAELPSWSGGTPVIWGDSIFVTSPSKKEAAAGDEAGDQGQKTPGEKGAKGKGFGGKAFGGKGGRSRRDPGGEKLLLLCFSKKDGSLRWQREIDTGNETYQKQNSSSPSPVTDGKHVWVVTGNGVVAALDFDGHVAWKQNLQQQYGKFGLNWGYGSSPLLYDGKVIIEVLHGNNTDDPSYLVAFDGQSGKVTWRTERPTDAPAESPDAYTTPALVTVNGQPQIVISGGDYVTGHDPQTGKELWRAAGLNPNKSRNFRIVGSPTVADGMIFAPTRNRPLLALKAGGSGDVTESNLAWKWTEDGGPDVPSPVSDGKYLYLVADNGLITCIDAKSGQMIYRNRLNVGATIDSSLLLADGKLYITGENAVTVVLAAGPEYQELARNELDGTFTLSSIAVAGQQLFLRTSTHLYCIGE
jgi:outer membrane protein assembly factor BamB